MGKHLHSEMRISEFLLPSSLPDTSFPLAGEIGTPQEASASSLDFHRKSKPAGQRVLRS
jgi:hypothetical protein